MGTNKKSQRKKRSTKQTKILHVLDRLKPRKLWQKILYGVVGLIAITVLAMYGIAQWYIHKHANEPLQFGTTFIAKYARYLDLDPEETLDAMINDLGIKRYRLVSYWSSHEPNKDKYDFSDLDWQFKKIEKAGGTVSLAIGLRQPRWPECHMPGWAHNLPEGEWQKELNEYLEVVIDRYKDSPALESYQLENEYLLEVFGECPDFSRERLIAEFDLVKKLDPNHPIIVTRSNNAVPSWPVGKPRADIVGAAVYKRVWDKTVTKRYFEYPLPAWYYAFLTGGTELTTGRNTILHELQAEPWPPMGLKEASLEEQNKSFDAKRLPSRLEYAVDTGMRTIDIWGTEWWYWRKVKANDPSVWETGKETIRRLEARENN